MTPAQRTLGAPAPRAAAGPARISPSAGVLDIDAAGTRPGRRPADPACRGHDVPR